MNGGHFLHCPDCDLVFRPSPHDRAPEFRPTSDGYTETVRDDCGDFLARHTRHALRTLRPNGDLMAHEGPLWDPMASTYWQVSFGTELFVVQGWRDALGEPLRYRLLAGRLVAEHPTVEVPEDEIRERIDRALYPGVVTERKLTAFVERFKAVVRDLDPATLEILYQVPDDPTLSIARPPASALEGLAIAARQIFDAADAARIEAHLKTSTEDADPFTVLVHRRVRVET